MEAMRIDRRTTPETLSARLDHDTAERTGLRRELEAWLASLPSRLVRLARCADDWLAQRRQERITRNALMHLSDRTLADIGVRRGDIPLIAKRIDPEHPEAHEGALTRWLRERGERQQVLRELMAYSNRELDDLDLRRRDIPAYLQAPRMPRPA